MRDLFDSNWFDLILCSATLEHDKRFWRSVSEMRRVLRPGGLLIISVPGYIKDPETDHGRSTHTYRVHYSSTTTASASRPCAGVLRGDGAGPRAPVHDAAAHLRPRVQAATAEPRHPGAPTPAAPAQGAPARRQAPPPMIEQLRAFTYERQRLGQAAPNPARALEDIIAVYSSHPSAPLSLHARRRR